MKQTPLYTNIEGDRDSIAVGAVSAIQAFGKVILDRDLKSIAWDRTLPNIGDFSRNGSIRVDDYKQALWDLYDQNRDREVFTLNVVNRDLVPDRKFSDLNRVYASSVQYLDLKTGELISPDKAGVIVSRYSFDSNTSDEYNRTRALLLGTHEMEHLVLGENVCESDKCVFSHNYSALDGMIEDILEGKQLPVCDLDKRRIEEFRKKWVK